MERPAARLLPSASAWKSVSHREVRAEPGADQHPRALQSRAALDDQQVALVRLREVQEVPGDGFAVDEPRDRLEERSDGLRPALSKTSAGTTISGWPCCACATPRSPGIGLSACHWDEVGRAVARHGHRHPLASLSMIGADSGHRGSEPSREPSVQQALPFHSCTAERPTIPGLTPISALSPCKAPRLSRCQVPGGPAELDDERQSRSGSSKLIRSFDHQRPLVGPGCGWSRCTRRGCR